MPPALPALTGARFLAAFSVVVYHYGRAPLRAICPLAATAAAAGPAAVSFFYVLSGAVLTWGYTDAQGFPSRSARAFWSQRAARIVPTYLLALALAVAPFAVLAWQLHPGMGGALRIAAGTGASLLLLQALWPPLAVVNTPGWSISCEAFFYALWPSLVGRFRARGEGFPWRPMLLLSTVALIASAAGIAALRAGWISPAAFPTLLEDIPGSELLARTLSYFPPLRLCEFLLGVAVGHALRKTAVRPRAVAADTLRELLLAGGLFGCATALGSGLASRLSGVALADRIAIEGPLLGPLFALLVWQLARGDGLLRRALSGRLLQALGEASYALYVLQEPLVVWTTAILKRVSPALAARWDLLFWGYAALLVATSLAVHRWIELPARAALASRLQRQTPRIVPPSVATGG
jgi:peptidoglycan/LPS O-acetylase OafA/YrhL